MSIFILYVFVDVDIHFHRYDIEWYFEEMI